MSVQNPIIAQQVLAPLNDTAAKPSIQFGGPTNADSGVGIYGDLANIRFAVGGVNVATINSSGIVGGGSVTSVAMSVPAFLSVSGSPITTSGTLAVSLSGTALPIANGGTASTSASAAFNALSPMTTGGDIIYGGASGAGTRLANGSAGQVLTSQGTTLAPIWSTNGSGTVTSVAMTVPSIMSVANSPVTSSGSLDVTLATQAANIVLAGPTTGGAAAPTFRALVAADIPASLNALTVASDNIVITTTKTPASAAAAGTAGMIAYDASFIYVCIATNTWTRVAIATW